ncbi:MAG: T9SS type A sorting domain-containing protein [Saprospiraceae bacterium]|nr:T9SS type A sorting domain-containing protein [Saprospiraceae bacterium]MCF8248856.1 T9SS type A sorting domain-containing protein [Saprospiraceae bacterium]MCF8279581.1 T9SS type A sorting domain-containing protein [Bacteroidales bacterium]MCF8310141.1 T9SS type A sorting domain-containing protein [Saprospiraceae bacterium]MCF8439041.1 T9SS type A sorting domain-containing protein [Saprospiraceae bacterium]
MKIFYLSFCLCLSTAFVSAQENVPFLYTDPWGALSMSNGNLTSNNAENYNSNNEHRMDLADHYVQLFHQTLSSGTFQVKLIAKTGGGTWAGTISLQSSPDGSTWTTLTPTITTIGNNGSFVTPSRALSSGTKYVRVFYTSRISGSNIGVDDFSVSGTPLPVELTLFNASIQVYSNELSWQTASELNNSHFSIEKSTNGMNYREIGIVQGHGTSLETNEYNFIDESPAKGTNYYRLKQVDFDGNFEYSKIVSVFFGETKGHVQLFPTIASNEVQLHFPSPTDDEGTIQIFDYNGKLVKMLGFEPEMEEMTIPTDDLARGTYLLKVNSSKVYETLRFIRI